MNHKLDDIEKKEVFKVPEGYFEKLPLNIQQRIQQKDAARVYHTPAFWVYATAAAMILVVSFVFLFQDQTSSAEELLVEVASEDLVAYLDQIDVDVYDLATTLPASTEVFEEEDLNLLDDLDLQDQSIDDLINEYNINSESIEI